MLYNLESSQRIRSPNYIMDLYREILIQNYNIELYYRITLQNHATEVPCEKEPADTWDVLVGPWELGGPTTDHKSDLVSTHGQGQKLSIAVSESFRCNASP